MKPQLQQQLLQRFTSSVSDAVEKLPSGMLRPQEAVAAFQHRLDHGSETETRCDSAVIPTRSTFEMVISNSRSEPTETCRGMFCSLGQTLTHLCLFSVTFSSSNTSLECGDRTTCTPHSSRMAMARSGPAVRASIRVRLSGVIFPPPSAEPLDQLLPFTPVACWESLTLLHCWDNWIKSFHSSKVWGSTPGKKKNKKKKYLRQFVVARQKARVSAQCQRTQITELCPHVGG